MEFLKPAVQPDIFPEIATTQAQANERKGLAIGFLGVLAFSLTLPATRVAVQDLSPAFVGLGRALFAGLLALAVLLLTRQPVPAKQHFRRLAISGAGVVLGFPLLTTWAMRYVPAAHGAIVVGLLPLGTAVIGSWLNREQPSRGFWIASATGSLLVLGFALIIGGGALHLADLALLGAVASAAWGYAEGARVTRSLGGWQTISWSLVLTLPVVVLPMLYLAWGTDCCAASLSAWSGFVYLVVVSQFLGFVAWYRGLALGGVARVSQMQLTQVFLTMLFAGLLLGETITPLMLVFAVAVVATVAIGRRMPVARKPA
jgi:drug/metabolite transporter (DMT)-like permease